ncbi:hypothetical protein E1B28_002667 [Marasmius oreades]|uniref:Transcription activator of gluconeogenesis ERT1 n=1 Tax=Marasmius oreades TaxID=181124 RepID=A0A9P7UP66_9AGAR|nr:uncharacterized protein E1B28_002667 [Marasmius oreades]KAG7086734.1 hypothetical protein E1B28_002667 [Marasmius oreades]
MADSEVLVPTVFISSENSAPIYVYPVNPTSTNTPGRTKRRQVKVACTNCQRACKKCDEARPCLRCVKYSIPHACVDAKRKARKKGLKRGPYKKNKDKNRPINSQSLATEPVSAPLPDPKVQETPATSSPEALAVPERVDYPPIYQHLSSTPQLLPGFHQKEHYYQSLHYIPPFHHQHRFAHPSAEHLEPVYSHQQGQASYHQPTFQVQPVYESHPPYNPPHYIVNHPIMVHPFSYPYPSQPVHEST